MTFYTRFLVAVCFWALLVAYTAATEIVNFNTGLPQSWATEERNATTGSTWYGEMILPSKLKPSLSVKDCETLAEQLYLKIAATGNIQNNIGPGKDGRLFGKGRSSNLLVSVYTYKGSNYYWFSTNPRGDGLKFAKNRINGVRWVGGRPIRADRSASYLRKALNTNSRNEISHQVHAEEAAFAIFEISPSGERMLPEGGTTYPPGSVVGTWESGKKPATGSWKSACSPDEGAAMSKNNDACSIVVSKLKVAARIKDRLPDLPKSSSSGQTSSASGSNSKGSKTSSKNCGRGLVSSDDGTGPACGLPNPKGSTPTGTKQTGPMRGAHSTHQRTQNGHPSTLKTMKAPVASTNARKVKPTATDAAHHKPTKTNTGRARRPTTTIHHQKPTNTKQNRPPKNTASRAKQTVPKETTKSKSKNAKKGGKGVRNIA